MLGIHMFCTYMCRKSMYIYLLHAYTRIYYHVYIYIYMCVCVYHLNRCKTSYWFSLVCRGRQGRCMAVANEAPCSWLGYGVWSTPRTCLFSDIARGQAKNPNHNIIQFAALLSQSGINFDIYMHQNFPQIFAENHIADSIMFFDLFSPRSCRRRTVGPFGKQSPKHYCGFSTCWLKLYGIWLWLRLTILDALHRFREVPHLAPLLI